MIKVLQIGFGHKVGGIQNCLLNFYRNMDRSLVSFDFVNMTGHVFYYENDIKILGGKIYNIPNEIKHPFNCYRKLIKLIRENNYDIVHINKNSLACMVAIKAVKDSGVNVRIIHSHSTKSNSGKISVIFHKFNKLLLGKLCNYYFACSCEAAEWMYTRKIISSDKFYLINNAIDINKFRFDEKKRKELRNEFNLENNIVIGHVGRFVEVKNHKFLIDLLKELIKIDKRYKLLLIGDGDLLNEIKDYAKSLGLNDYTIFLGNRRDVSDFYQAMDIFVLPSFYEGLPIVGIEAQCSGLPSIFSDTITKQVKILDTTHFLSLNSNIKEWVNVISSYSFKINRDVYNTISNSEFNIRNEAQKLQNLYFKFIEQGKVKNDKKGV